MKENLNDKIAFALLSMQRLPWEQGVAAQAFFETGDDKMGIAMVKEAIHRQTEDGRLGLCDIKMDAVDCGANGLPAWYAYKLTGNRAYLDALSKMAQWMLDAPKAACGLILHNIGKPNTMVDGVYHILPMMIAAGYADFAMQQWRLFKKIHFNGEKGLYSQYWNDETRSFDRADFWGPGVGWMAAALPLAWMLLGSGRERERDELKCHFDELMAAALSYMRQDGLFFDVLDDENTFPQTTTPLMFAYAIYRAVQLGMADKQMLTQADRMFFGAMKHADDEGYVQNGCASPYFDRPGVSAETQAFAMMCNAARDEVYAGRNFRFAVI